MNPTCDKAVSRPCDLAICTGKPRFPEPLHVGRPNIGSEDALIERIRGVLKRRWFTNDGQLVQEFERKLERFLSVRHCVAICNATVALEIAIRALELNGEVIVPSFTFIAAVHALQWHNVTPVFCDVGPDSHNLDPGLIEGLITPVQQESSAFMSGATPAIRNAWPRLPKRSICDCCTTLPTPSAVR